MKLSYPVRRSRYPAVAHRIGNYSLVEKWNLMSRASVSVSGDAENLQWRLRLRLRLRRLMDLLSTSTSLYTSHILHPYSSTTSISPCHRNVWCRGRKFNHRSLMCFKHYLFIYFIFFKWTSKLSGKYLATTFGFTKNTLCIEYYLRDFK